MLLVVAGITSQRLHSSTKVTQTGRFNCKYQLWMPAGFRGLFLLLPSTPHTCWTDMLRVADYELCLYFILNYSCGCFFFSPACRALSRDRWRHEKRLFSHANLSTCIVKMVIYKRQPQWLYNQANVEVPENVIPEWLKAGYRTMFTAWYKKQFCSLNSFFMLKLY